MRVLVFLLLLACTGRAFDTVYAPGQHTVVLPIQCDDRVDSSFVNLANAYGIVINFAPYKFGGTQIVDYDSNFTANSAYHNWVIDWAKRQGMTFATHAQVQSTTILDTYGQAGIDSIFDMESEWLKSAAGIAGNVPGHVWTGHVNSPATRAQAKEYGYTYTRGALADSRDLYLSAFGWESEVGGGPFMAPAFMHRALVPSMSMYRFTGYTVGDSLYKLCTAADTTYLWNGTKKLLTEMAGKNAMGVMNIHPAWGVPWAETVTDSIAAVWVHIPDTYGGDPDSIMFSKHMGVSTRNDVSAYQLDYILRAAKYWDDSCFVADGVRRLCIPELNTLMASNTPNWRDDNTADPDSVSDWFAGATAGNIDEDYWTSNDGLYAKDPAVDRDHIVYIDGTGTVKAGNGTETYPLPWRALNSAHNCRVEVVGHAAGDTLTLQKYYPTTEAWADRSWWQPKGANVTVDFNGLTILAAAANKATVQFDTSGVSYYNHNIEWRNATIDARGSTSGGFYSVIVGNTSTAAPDSLDPSNIRFVGCTFRNGYLQIKGRNCQDLLIDSCFVDTGVSTNASIAYSGGEIVENAMIRNSLLDISDGGASSIVVDFNTALEPADSMRFINNIAVIGKNATTAHYLLRSTNATVDTTGTLANSLRFDRNYVVNNITGASSANIWNDLARAAARPWTQFQARITAYNPTFSGTMFFPGKRLAFNYLTNTSDTLRFGGYTGTGSRETGLTASIGPSVFGYYPLVWTSGAVQGRAAAATLQGPWEALSLVNNGVLSASTATDPDTWFEIPRIYDESSLAVARGFLDAWEKWPSAAQAKVRFKVSGEPVTVITSADSTYQTLGQLDAALTAAAETASDSLVASTWFTLPRPYNLNAAFQIEIIRAWWRSLAEANRKKIRLRVSGTDYSMAMPDTTYSNGLWAVSKAISTGAETASDSLDAATWFSLPRVYDMAQAQQAGVFMDAWEMWPDAKRKQIRMKTK